MKHISVVTACYNEEENVRELVERVRQIFAGLPQYTYEHIFIDNCSTDRTVAILREIARDDPNVKVIVNARNFGHIRSPFHALRQAHGDAVISLVADFQDPPEMIVQFLQKWEEGYKIVVGVKDASDEPRLMYAVRSVYYRLVSRLAEVDLVRQFTGFGLYDKRVMDVIRTIDDPYPYFRGLISEIGYDICKITYRQPQRQRGLSKINWYALYDMAMLGITNHSRVPLRVATLAGFVMSGLSLLMAFAYLVLKLLFWDWLTAGIAPIIISLFFFSSVQLFFIGILGEYIGAILTQVQKRPHVVERERINFPPPEPGAAAAPHPAPASQRNGHDGAAPAPAGRA